MRRSVHLTRPYGNGFICMGIDTGKRATRIFLTEEQAQHLSNRLQSFAKGNHGAEKVVEEIEL